MLRAGPHCPGSPGERVCQGAQCGGGDHRFKRDVSRPGFAVSIFRGSANAPLRPPAFGENTAAILEELGFSEEKIRKLARNQVI